MIRNPRFMTRAQRRRLEDLDKAMAIIAQGRPSLDTRKVKRMAEAMARTSPYHSVDDFIHEWARAALRGEDMSFLPCHSNDSKEKPE